MAAVVHDLSFLDGISVRGILTLNFVVASHVLLQKGEVTVEIPSYISILFAF